MHAIQIVLIVVLCTFVWLRIILSLVFAEDITIYEKDWQVEERIQDGTIYDQDWRVKGHIEEGKVYNRDWNLEKRIEGDKIHDRNWNLGKRIDKDRIYDKNWNLKGYIKRGKKNLGSHFSPVQIVLIGQSRQ